jgi:hypothetical protein
VWLIGQVAAILFGAHQHLPVRLVDMLGVLLRLPPVAGRWPSVHRRRFGLDRADTVLGGHLTTSRVNNGPGFLLAGTAIGSQRE